MSVCESKCKISYDNIDLFSEKTMMKLPRIKTVKLIDGFIFRVNTEFVNDYSTDFKQFKLPLIETGVYNFTVYWGDGETDNITTWDEFKTIHTYENTGIYTIRISGQCEGWAFQYNGDYIKMVDISQWGTQFKLGNMQFGGYFEGCENLNISAKDTLNLEGTTSLYACFADCKKLNSNNLSNWDVSQVTTTNSMFSGCTIFNQPLNRWNVGNVTDMSYMFSNCTNFNQPLNSWQVDNVTLMIYMFSNCTNFNQPLNSWQVDNVIQLINMFASCLSFKQDISSWNPISCQAFNGMFNGTDMNATGTTTNYDNLLISWASKNLASGMTFDAGLSKRSNTGQPAFITLTTTKGWTIIDGGLQPP